MPIHWEPVQKLKPLSCASFLYFMTGLKLFTDGSVNPSYQIGYGAYLLVASDTRQTDTLAADVKTKRFEQTSSTKLELQTLLWALNDIDTSKGHVTVYTDSQNIIGLPERRERFEKNDYMTKKNRLIANHALYREFYEITDRLKCDFVKVRGHKQSHEKDAIDRIFTLVDRASRDALRTK